VHLVLSLVSIVLGTVIGALGLRGIRSASATEHS